MYIITRNGAANEKEKREREREKERERGNGASCVRNIEDISFLRTVCLL